MERGVKAGHLQKPGLPFSDGPHWQKIVRLVQRRERHQLCELVHHPGVDSNRGGVGRAAMDHAMAHGCQTSSRILALANRKGNRARRHAREGNPPPRVFADGRAIRIFRMKASPPIKLLQFAGNAHFEGVAVPHQKLGELKARGAGVENENASLMSPRPSRALFPPSLIAFTAPAKDDSSQGSASKLGTGGSAMTASIMRSAFLCDLLFMRFRPG